MHNAQVEGEVSGVDGGGGKIGGEGRREEGREMKEKEGGDGTANGSGENGNIPKHRVTFGHLDANDWKKHNGNHDEKPKFSRKVTFGGCDEPGDSNEMETEGDKEKTEQNTTHHTTLRRRHVGIMLDDGVDHSEICDMLCEMGNFGEKKNCCGQGSHGDGRVPSGKEDTWMVKTVSNLDAKPVNMCYMF